MTGSGRLRSSLLPASGRSDAVAIHHRTRKIAFAIQANGATTADPSDFSCIAYHICKSLAFSGRHRNDAAMKWREEGDPWPVT